MSLQVEADQEGGVAPLAPFSRLVACGRGDQIELGELHVAGDVDPSASGPVVGDVLIGVSNYH